MGTRPIELPDVREGPPTNRWRLLAPLRYLAIRNPEKTRYDIMLPAAVGAGGWLIYFLIEPKPPLFGAGGLLVVVRDFLIMAVPFMVGALAAVAMGSPGQHLDRRPLGVELWLDGELLTMRQFVCYLLGYLCFLGIIILLFVVGAMLLEKSVAAWTASAPALRDVVRLRRCTRYRGIARFPRRHRVLVALFPNRRCKPKDWPWCLKWLQRNPSLLSPDREADRKPMCKVQIWAAREGFDPTPGWSGREPHPFFLGELPLSDAESKLGLRRHHRFAAIETRGTLGDTSKHEDFSEPRFVVAILEEPEAAKTDWQSGYYYIVGLPPGRARQLIG